MNRQQRRKYNAQHQTNYGRQQFEFFKKLDKLRLGQLTLDEFQQQASNMEIVLDNLFPNNTKVKLNSDLILSRPSPSSPALLDWVRLHKDQEFTICHIDTEEGRLVTLVEDIVEVKQFDDKGEEIPYCQHVFDLYSDLLIYDTDQNTYRLASEIESEVLSSVSRQMESNKSTK